MIKFRSAGAPFPVTHAVKGQTACIQNSMMNSSVELRNNSDGIAERVKHCMTAVHVDYRLAK